MRRHVLVLGSALSLALALLLVTSSRPTPADAQALPVPAVDGPTGQSLPTRRHPPAASTPTPRAERPVPTVQVAIELSHSPSDTILPGSLLMPSWDPELAWPLPDELPEALTDDPVFDALQETLATVPGSEQEGEALDSLELALLDHPDSVDAWSSVARLEAERQLARADYRDDLLDHDQRLLEWSGSNGEGPRPELAMGWEVDALADDALELADTIDAFDDDPEAADIARLTAAAVLLDWESRSFNEQRGAAAALDVIHHTSDPAMLAAATDLLVGTAVELSETSLDALTELTRRGELPPSTTTRLAWFLSNRHLQAGRPQAALAVLDDGLAASALLPPTPGDLDALDTHRARAALEAGRGAVLGLSGRSGQRSLTESVQAAAWRCWTELLEQEDPWVTEGTEYEAHAMVSVHGLQWLDWTDDNPHRTCLDAELSAPVPLESPTQLRILIALPSY